LRRLRRRPRPLQPEEAAYIDRIEAERAALERSTAEALLVDYGARSPDSPLSAEEMAAGIEVRRVMGEVCRTSSKPPEDARFLFDVIRERRPGTCLELGTCIGISAAYEAAALELNDYGFLYTIEGAEPLAVEARALLRRLRLEQRVDVRVGRFADVLPDLLESNVFDYVFVDGHHDEHATIEYFELILPRTRSGATMVFDDIDWSEGMRRAWRAIRSSDALASTRREGTFAVALVG
jgi:predicted O-methyltransferase YrrM